MASTYSTSLRLELVGDGEQSGAWGVTTNRNLGTLLESAIAGVASVTHDDSASYSLTELSGVDDESRHMIQEIGGTLTANRNVVVPDATKLYVVKNATAGGFSIVVKTSAGTGVTISNGSYSIVYSDGTNVVEVISSGATGALALLDTVSATEIDSDAITNAKMADDSVDTAEIVDGAVTAAKLASDSVTTVKILDDNVTTAKIAAANITATELASDAVTTAKILDGNVTKAKIENLTNYTVLGNVTGGAAAPAEVTILDQDTMSGDSATSLATQQSIKAYVDAALATALAADATGILLKRQRFAITTGESGTRCTAAYTATAIGSWLRFSIIGQLEVDEDPTSNGNTSERLQLKRAGVYKADLFYGRKEKVSGSVTSHTESYYPFEIESVADTEISWTLVATGSGLDLADNAYLLIEEFTE